jgi:hypothetical protein
MSFILSLKTRAADRNATIAVLHRHLQDPAPVLKNPRFHQQRALTEDSPLRNDHHNERRGVFSTRRPSSWSCGPDNRSGSYLTPGAHNPAADVQFALHSHTLYLYRRRRWTSSALSMVIRKERVRTTSPSSFVRASLGFSSQALSVFLVQGEHRDRGYLRTRCSRSRGWDQQVTTR